MNDNLSTEEAYRAMFTYLEQLYELTGSDDLGGFLGSMQLKKSGGTMDPAAWEDWLKAVGHVISARKEHK